MSFVAPSGSLIGMLGGKVMTEWDGLTEGGRATLAVAELLSQVKALEADLATRDAKTCATCEWYRDTQHIDNYCAREIQQALHCAPNGFKYWRAKETE